MPIYAYRCEECGHELDALQKISDPPLTECPACGAEALKKQLTAAAFRLKGGGWYETDFKKDGKKNLHDAGDKAPSGDAAGKADKPADKAAAEPAAKSATKPAKDTGTAAGKGAASGSPKAAA
ncbi:zinc ribbon domain-containing protein [Thiohalocapsa marina]|uniref:Zinc ribbon domain-containing protein n=1 Tax=Thiohalocapsa marina TaxID=424902 RepID=A0A5M8FV78_9GAMM|nr:zinc ribbon domain-containing protein [Thiohalocapsa marina]KAA6187724.1 zinc ribbon domain-containing protein [Thiohalocapsa marina]